MNILSIYTDGSYREHGGWSNVIFDSSKKLYPLIVYGTCDAKTSTHAETIACIRALDNYIWFSKYDLVEIRTDQSYIVDITSKLINCRSLGLEFPNIKYGKYDEELQCIAYIQYQLGEKLRFRKAPENHFLRLAHNHAKAALKLNPDSSTFFYKAEPQNEPKAVQYFSISGADLKEQYSKISNSTVSQRNNSTLDLNKYINVRVKDIDMRSKTHLEAKHIKLSGELAKISNGEKTLKPITVLQLPNGRYELTSGFKFYCLAKIMDVEFIPCNIITSHPLSENSCA